MKSRYRSKCYGPPHGCHVRTTWHLAFVLVVEHQEVLLASGHHSGPQTLVLPQNLWFSPFLKIARIIFWGMQSRALTDSLFFYYLSSIFLWEQRQELAQHSKINTSCRWIVPITASLPPPNLAAASFSLSVFQTPVFAPSLLLCHILFSQKLSSFPLIAF